MKYGYIIILVTTSILQLVDGQIVNCPPLIPPSPTPEPQIQPCPPIQPPPYLLPPPPPPPGPPPPSPSIQPCPPVVLTPPPCQPVEPPPPIQSPPCLPPPPPPLPLLPCPPMVLPPPPCQSVEPPPPIPPPPCPPLLPPVQPPPCPLPLPPVQAPPCSPVIPPPPYAQPSSPHCPPGPVLPPEPPQSQCTSLKALRYPDPNPSIQQTSCWTVLRVTPLPQPYPPGLDTSKNVCGVLSYISGCQGIRWVVDVGTHTRAQIYAYSDLTQDTVEYDQSLVLQDQYYSIFISTINRMSYIRNDGTCWEANPIPQSLIQLQSEKMYAVVSECPAGKWRIFRTCDQILTWVIVPTDGLRDPNFLQTVNPEIDSGLQQLGINVSTLIQISTMPFEPPRTSAPATTTAMLLSPSGTTTPQGVVPSPNAALQSLTAPLPVSSAVPQGFTSQNAPFSPSPVIAPPVFPLPHITK